jgi:hypothetical protein
LNKYGSQKKNCEPTFSTRQKSFLSSDENKVYAFFVFTTDVE